MTWRPVNRGVRHDVPRMALRLPDRWMWDFWFAVDGEEVHVFYLQAPRSLGDPELRHRRATIGHAVSSDLRSWRIRGDALGPGGRGEDGWHMYYTGLGADGVQRVGLAASHDLERWEKRGMVVEADPAVYERENWRDPWVIEVDGRSHMLLCARAAGGPQATRGVIGHAERGDDGAWRARPPLSEPGDYFQLEVPQVVWLGGAWRCLFCTEHGAQWGTHYLTGPTPLGPFALDDPEFLAADAAGTHYAGRVLEHGGGRHFFAWRQHDAGGEFLGELSDPMEIREGPPPWVGLP
jgi:beta-fructofuranosidase